MVSCNNCGKKDISFFFSNWAFQFCSFSCQARYYRYLSAGATVIAFLFTLVNLNFLGIFILGVLYTLWGFFVTDKGSIPQASQSRRRRALRKEPLGANYQYHQLGEQQRQSSTSRAPEETVYVPGLDRNFKACCYQSARLGDAYCPCGRAVDQELIEHLSA